MKSKLSAFVLLLALLVLGAASGWVPASDRKAQAVLREVVAAPTVAIPTVPDGKCCLWRLSKVGKGQLDQRLGAAYPCKLGETARGAVRRLEVKLGTGDAHCEELPRLIPVGSWLVATDNVVHVIRRKDDLAHFSGSFRILSPDRRMTLFRGYLEAIQRISTHHNRPFGGDKCDPKDRLQGWLVGTGDGAAKGFTLRALLIARTEPLSGGEKGYALPEVGLDGVLIECPE